jgi:hypothetical protein
MQQRCGRTGYLRFNILVHIFYTYLRFRLRVGIGYPGNFSCLVLHDNAFIIYANLLGGVKLLVDLRSSFI